MVPGATIGRAGFARFLTDTIRVIRRTDTPDGSGGSTISEATVATVAGRIATDMRPREEGQGGREVGVVTYTAFLAYGTEVLPSDRLQRGDDVFEVVDDTAAETDGLATVVTVRRIR